MSGERAPTLLYAVTVGMSARIVLKGQFADMRRRGYRTVLVCSPDEETKAFAAEEGVEYFPLPMKRGLLTPHDLVSFLRAVLLVREIDPDVVYFATPKAGFLLGPACRLARVPNRIYGMWGLRLEGERPGSLRYHLLRLAEYLTCRCAHVVLLPSASLRERAVSLRLVGRSGTRVLGRGSANGVDLGQFRPVTWQKRREARAREGIEPTDVVFGFVGRLVRDKGVDTLVRALDEVPEHLSAKLLLVGDIEDGHRLSRPVLDRIRDDPRIRLTGFVEDPSPWYRLMDVVVLPSRREGLPTVLLEAAASALPVITTDATGCRDAVDEGVTALVVPVDDAQRLAGAMVALAGDRAARERMGKAGRVFVEKHFDRSLVWSRTAAFIESLVRGVPMAPEISGKFVGEPRTVKNGRSA